jgi:hypothetical protein
MKKNKVIRVTKEEFELDNGEIFPIIPPLEKEISPEEFQIHYERAINIIRGITNFGSDNDNS